ncbi:MAG TPA: hypothetical protein VK171_17155 [Fimbriimonas sp.]|nr:hypothetical protein [Fimbriimonas sp.]
MKKLVGFGLAALMLSMCMVGCDDDDEEEETSSTNQTASAGGGGVSQSTSDTELIRDPVEDSFTVEAPKGWYNKAYSTRIFDIHRQVVTCVSPNSDTVIFLGDPNMPQYWDPAHANPVTYEWAKVNPMQKIEPYRPATEYFREYATKKFGKLGNFEISRTEMREDVMERMATKLAEKGIQTKTVEIVEVYFSYDDKGKKMSGLLSGSTIDYGQFWIAMVGGLSTAGKVEDYKPMMEKLSASLIVLPEWTAKQQAKHEEIMEQIRVATARQAQRHANNMNWIQDSAQRHQKRMQAIWAQGDASMNAYYKRSAASDLQHQNFLNTINEESTVVNSSGQAFQVDNKYDRYYINKNDPSKYVGGDIRLDHDKLGALGVNPNDYEEVKIRSASGN